MRTLTLMATSLAFVVVVLGAFVRLSDAGLGCPDWPGCYGHPTPAMAGHEIAAAHAADPSGPVSAPKAWKEMVHRYLAGTLGILIFVIALAAWRRQTEGRRTVPTVLAALVVLQALLGMWTVTLQLMPAVVTAHLLGGMGTLALLAWLASEGRSGPSLADAKLRGVALTLLFLLAAQITLGGWVSTNYAALACTDLPTCGGRLWPTMDLADAFRFERTPGLLPLHALVAIHVIHRLGALIVLAVSAWLAWGLFATRGLASQGWLLMFVVALQVSLGVANVLLSLPLPVAVAHNAGAALLLITVIRINVRLNRSRP